MLSDPLSRAQIIRSKGAVEEDSIYVVKFCSIQLCVRILHKYIWTFLFFFFRLIWMSKTILLNLTDLFHIAWDSYKSINPFLGRSSYIGWRWILNGLLAFVVQGYFLSYPSLSCWLVGLNSLSLNFYIINWNPETSLILYNNVLDFYIIYQLYLTFDPLRILLFRGCELIYSKYHIWLCIGALFYLWIFITYHLNIVCSGITVFEKYFIKAFNYLVFEFRPVFL